jgi:hypothetical protein
MRRQAAILASGEVCCHMLQPRGFASVLRSSDALGAALHATATAGGRCGADMGVRAGDASGLLLLLLQVDRLGWKSTACGFQCHGDVRAAMRGDAASSRGVSGGHAGDTSAGASGEDGKGMAWDPSPAPCDRCVPSLSGAGGGA